MKREWKHLGGDVLLILALVSNSKELVGSSLVGANNLWLPLRLFTHNQVSRQKTDCSGYVIIIKIINVVVVVRVRVSFLKFLTVFRYMKTVR